jgi:hypothetical protein
MVVSADRGCEILDIKAATLEGRLSEHIFNEGCDRWCRTIERGMTEYGGCIIEPRGRVYIGV